MNIKKIIASVSALILAVNTQMLCPVFAQQDTAFDEWDGIIHTDGRLLKDENGKEYPIKGIGFGNNVWSNPKTPPKDLHHTEESYKELAAVGINNIRFYLNYALFESDSDPYNYLETGFNWIDENIALAKKYGIRLLLNMHYPQGGYQSQGAGTALWTNVENQKRLSALWKEIAKRYSDEPVILGYGIVNEPIAAVKGTGSDALDLWQSLAQDITDAIREADTAHPIFVEKMCAFQDLSTLQSNWVNYNDDNNYVKINDDNVVYEFHDYDPYQFTHQGFNWANTQNYDYSYPDDNCVMASSPEWTMATFSGDTASTSDEEWQYLESSFLTADTDRINAVNFVIQAKNIGSAGSVYADKLKLDEYDENGKLLKTLYFDDCTDTSLSFWSEKNTGKYYKSTIGHEDDSAICITGITSDGNCGSNYFIPVNGHKYKASCYVKAVNVSDDAEIRPRCDGWNCQSVNAFNKEYLEKSVLSNIKFSIDNDVPVYCGEFGAGAPTFKNDRGGEIWVRDMLELFSKYNVGYNYHTFHEDSFGLYRNSALLPPAQRNNVLYKAIADANGKPVFDVNSDGTTDTTDADTLKSFLVKDIDTVPGVTDITGDGKTNVFDLISLIRKVK